MTIPGIYICERCQEVFAEHRPSITLINTDARLAALYVPHARSVGELILSTRCRNGLKNANINTIYELVQRSRRDMLKIKNFGRKSLQEIEAILNRLGLSLDMQFCESGTIIWPPSPEDIARWESEKQGGRKEQDYNEKEKTG